MYPPLVSNAEQTRTLSLPKTLMRQVQACWCLWFGKSDDAIQHWVQLLKQGSDKPRLAEVRQLIKGEAFQEARDYLESLKGEPAKSRPEMQELLARCYLGQGLLREAQASINLALELEPERADCWDLLAECLLELGDWQAAVAALDKSLRAAPNRPETIFRLGNIYAYHQKYEDALRCFQGCCRLSPRRSEYWEMKAEMHLQLEQIAPACESFEKAWRYGVNPELASRLAYCYVQLNQVKKGIRYYNLVLKYDPNHYDALCNLAAVLQNEGRSLESLRLLERAQAVYANDPILLNNLAYVLVHLGRTRKAAEYYQMALELSPKHPMIMYNLSVCLARKGNWDGAIAMLDQLLAAVPDHEEGWILLGNIYDELAYHDLATDCFNRALKLA